MTLRRRLHKLDRMLDPTQIVVRWLVEAQACGSLDAWMVGNQGAASREPLTALATEAAVGVRETMKGRPAPMVEEAVAEAVGAVLHRVFIILVLHDHLEIEHRVDALEVELLTVTRRCLGHGGTSAMNTTAWAARCSRLLQETVTWQQAILVLAHRYFAGHPPAFPDQIADLDATATACTHLVARSHTTGARGRKDLPSIDRAAVQELGEANAEVAATSIAERAAEQADLFTGTQAGTFRLRGLLATSRLPRTSPTRPAPVEGMDPWVG